MSTADVYLHILIPSDLVATGVKVWTCINPDVTDPWSIEVRHADGSRWREMAGYVPAGVANMLLGDPVELHEHLLQSCQSAVPSLADLQEVKARSVVADDHNTPRSWLHAHGYDYVEAPQ